MLERLIVAMDAQTGKPFVQVPSSRLWDLVEYLSIQRVAVQYDCHETFFTIQFLRSSQTAAQELIDGWGTALEDWRAAEVAMSGRRAS